MRPLTAASAAANGLPAPRPPSQFRVTGPSNLRPGDIVLRHAEELVVTRVVRNVDDTVVHYRDGHQPDTFGIGTVVSRRRPR